MRWASLLVVACFALGLLAPSPSFGAPVAGLDGKIVKDKGKEKKDGKEAPHHEDDSKIDLFKGWIDLTVWTIAVFLILFAILANFAWPQIRAGLDAREAAIAADKAEADKARHEATQLRQELQAEMAKAHDEARRIVDKAVADARASAAEEVAKGKADLAAERERMHADVSRERDQALAEIWSQGAQLATLISSKAIGRSLSEDDHRALLAQALDEFKAAARGRVRDLEGARA